MFSIQTLSRNIVLAGIAVVSACVADASDPASTRAVVAELGDDRQPLNEVVRAKRLADRMLNIVRANADAPANAIVVALRPSIVELQQLSLSLNQLYQINDYLVDNGADVAVILSGLGFGSPLVFPGLDFPEPTDGQCFTQCLGFLQFECETNVIVGVCIGAWGCDAGLGEHLCVGDDGGSGSSSECQDESDCAPGWNCATWVFKPNECVQECETNSDCPSGQKCKKPLGTSFKRCK